MSSLLAATGSRHGIVAAPREVRRTFAEPAGVVNVAVPDRSAAGWSSAAGGIARTYAEAEAAAVGEALERYAAHACELPRRRRDELPDPAVVVELEDFSLYATGQLGHPEFPHHSVFEGERTYTNVFDASTNRELWVPFELVGLSPRGAGVATSSGLAAAPTALDALLRALQELIERDALMVTWLHGIPARRVHLPPDLAAEVATLGGEALVVDATPADSPHPVALVTGQLPLRGEPRYSLGAACRATWREAVHKAYLEWVQGVTFVSYYRDFHPGLAYGSPHDVRTFDDHAVYYSVRPDRWPRLPLLRGAVGPEPPDGPPGVAALVRGLATGRVRVFYRELTTPDVRQAGLRVVRALSPDLAPIHCDERWPFLGGTVTDVHRRYPWVSDGELCFPNPYPHPLG